MATRPAPRKAPAPAARTSRPTPNVPIKATKNEVVDPKLEAMVEEDAGRGLDGDASDLITPRIYVLHSTSPQALKKNPNYIEGAEGGDIWLRGAENPIVKGEDGIWFQPVFYWKSWSAWVPRDEGGGLAGTYLNSFNNGVDEPVNPPEGYYKDPKGFNWISDDSTTTISLDRNFAGCVIGHGPFPLPYVITFRSTGHAVGRAWYTSINSMTTKNGNRAPIFYKKWFLRTALQQKANQTWHLFSLIKNEPVTPDQYILGRQLHEQFASNQRRAEEEVASE